jgi:hypothetical protein
MYARVASFEGRDPSLTDELIERVRELGPGAVADARGFFGLFDREGGTALTITFFDSEEAIRGSEPAFEEMAQHFRWKDRPTASMRAPARRARRRSRRRASCPAGRACSASPIATAGG